MQARPWRLLIRSIDRDLCCSSIETYYGLCYWHWQIFFDTLLIHMCPHTRWHLRKKTIVWPTSLCSRAWLRHIEQHPLPCARAEERPNTKAYWREVLLLIPLILMAGSSNGPKNAKKRIARLQWRETCHSIWFGRIVGKFVLQALPTSVCWLCTWLLIGFTFALEFCAVFLIAWLKGRITSGTVESQLEKPGAKKNISTWKSMLESKGHRLSIKSNNYVWTTTSERVSNKFNKV